MKRAAALLVVISCTAVSAQQTPPPSLDLAGSLKLSHQNIRRNLAASAEKMPEADFHFKPQGTSAEVRTYGQIIAHLANSNYAVCALVKGEPPPAKPLDDERAMQPKAELVKALNDSLAYCDAVYDGQTAASINEMVKRQGRNNVTLERARGIPLFSNVAHNNEHYGNLVTYLRAKGIVPPSSEPR